MTKNIFAAIAIAASLSSCVVNVEEQTIDKEVHANASQFNSLSFDGGALSEKLVIKGVTMDTLSAYATASVWGNNDEDATRIAQGMELEWSGTTDARLTLNYPGSEKEFIRIGDLRIDAPQRLDLNIDLSSADVDIRNMTGNVNIDVSSGDVAVGTTGKIDIETSSGNVNVTTGRGGQIDASSGDIRVDITQKNFDELIIESSSGDVVINIAEGAGIDFELDASSGVIAINYGGFAVVDSEGRVTVSVNGGGRRVVVNSSSGDIQIGKL